MKKTDAKGLRKWNQVFQKSPASFHASLGGTQDDAKQGETNANGQASLSVSSSSLAEKTAAGCEAMAKSTRSLATVSSQLGQCELQRLQGGNPNMGSCKNEKSTRKVIPLLASDVFTFCSRNLPFFSCSFVGEGTQWDTSGVCVAQMAIRIWAVKTRNQNVALMTFLKNNSSDQNIRSPRRSVLDHKILAAPNWQATKECLRKTHGINRLNF